MNAKTVKDEELKLAREELAQIKAAEHKPPSDIKILTALLEAIAA